MSKKRVIILTEPQHRVVCDALTEWESNNVDLPPAEVALIERTIVAVEEWSRPWKG